MFWVKSALPSDLHYVRHAIKFSEGKAAEYYWGWEMGVIGVVGSSSHRIKFGANVVKSSCEGIANEI